MCGKENHRHRLPHTCKSFSIIFYYVFSRISSSFSNACLAFSIYDSVQFPGPSSFPIPFDV